jgi:hypothetical protein
MGTNTSENGDVRAVLDGVRRIVQSLRESSRWAEKYLGMTGAQLFVLQELDEAPAQSLNDLAARTHTHQSSVSTIVARLVDQGFVTRTRSSRDGRTIELHLSRLSPGPWILPMENRRCSSRSAPALAVDAARGMHNVPGTSRRLGDFTATPRMVMVGLMAVAIGAVCAYVARGLLLLINFFTNLFFFQRLSAAAAGVTGFQRPSRRF